MPGGCQKEDQGGSKTPAPGQTMSRVGKWVEQAVKAEWREGQERTSVLWKMARGKEEDVEEYWETRVSASGRRDRSAMRTLQPRERRRRANSRLIPVVHWQGKRGSTAKEPDKRACRLS